MGDARNLRVTIAYSPAARDVFEETVQVAEGTTVLDALLASSLAQRYPDLQLPGAGIGVWGRAVGPSQLVSEGDRIEVYRGLLVDPKVARRERFNRQGARGTGLFARRRPGGKAGY